MREPDYAAAIAYALGRLRTELPPHLNYHNVCHTEHDVMPAATRLARLSNVSQDDIHLLEVAAAFHDLGWIETQLEHEQRSGAAAAQVLPQYGFDAERIERIVGMIMATRIPQSPRNLLDALLADADLDMLGREDFLQRNNALRQEQAALGRVYTNSEWLASQATFLEGHVYFTPAARALRAEGQQANLALFIAQFRQDG